MCRDDAVAVLARFLEEAAATAKGAVASVSVRQIRKWYARAMQGELPYAAMRCIGEVLKALHALGHMEVLGRKYVFRLNSEFGKAVAEGRAAEFIADALSRWMVARGH